MRHRLKKLHCCGCNARVRARLTNGAEVHPHRKDLSHVPLWKCDQCSNHVGCHRGTTQPLGNIATPEIRQARQQIHGVLDPIWKSGAVGRKELYRMISAAMGYEYHTAEINTLEEARKVWKIVVNFRNGLDE